MIQTGSLDSILHVIFLYISMFNFVETAEKSWCLEVNRMGLTLMSKEVLCEDEVIAHYFFFLFQKMQRKTKSQCCLGACSDVNTTSSTCCIFAIYSVRIRINR